MSQAELADWTILRGVVRQGELDTLPRLGVLPTPHLLVSTSHDSSSEYVPAVWAGLPIDTRTLGRLSRGEPGQRVLGRRVFT